MNWKRGFFRLWLALSLLWIASVGWLTYDRHTFAPVILNISGPAGDTYESVPVPPDFLHYDSDRQSKDVDKTVQLLKDGKRSVVETTANAAVRVKARTFVTTLVLPPMSLLIVGIVADWIIRGFRSPRG